VDDGYELDTAKCELGDAVSPTSQLFSATDAASVDAFECGFTCDADGASVTLTYE
jgi:hypothetical protein